MDEDYDLLASIVELRRYAQAKQQVEAAKKPADWEGISEWAKDWVTKVKKYLLDRHKAKTERDG